MRKGLLRSVAILTVLALLLSFTACTNTNPAKPATGASAAASTATQSPDVPKEMTLTIWHSAFTSAAEKEKPENEWTVNKIFKNFEAANPGVTIVSVFQADQQVAQSKLKAAVLANNAPDIINTYSGYLVTALSDALLDITQYVPGNDLSQITGWASVRKNLAADGPIYGYPAAGAELGCLVYNKSLVSAAGVDLEGAGKPKTAEEFITAMKKIKDSGVQPIVAKDDGYNSAWMFPFGAWWTQYVGSERVTSDSLGKTKFVDDAAFIKTLSFANRLFKEGIINQDYITIADPASEFYNKRAAMMVTGNWEIQNCIDQLGEDAGLYTVPSFDTDVKYPDAAIGGVGQSFSVSKTCKNPAMAVKLLSFYNNKENVLTMAKINSKMPQRTDITPEELSWAGKPIFEKLMKICNNNLFGWNDNAMQPDVMNEYYVQSSLAVIGKITAKQCAEALDAKAAEVNK